jgi:hypothetical protein
VNRQAGLTTVEFAILGAVFFIVLFGVIEFGRLLFTWNTLSEATRRATRVAVVCPLYDDAIARAAMFLDTADGSGTPVLPRLRPDNVLVRYLDDEDEDASAFEAIRFVRVQIDDYQHEFFVPFLRRVIQAPAFETTLPRESLGVVPGVGVGC